MKHPRESQWLKIVLFNLLIVAVAGLILRAFRYAQVPILNYSNFMEAHSHFAFGGWGFMSLFIGFYFAFLNKEKIKRKTYSYIFWTALLSVWGMFFSFPFRGYAAVSTAFSTLYIWITYWFAIKFYRDIKKQEETISLKFVKAALFFLVFSSIGPYTMGALMAAGYGHDPKAMNAIYFYLHFQYNGWLTFGILALLFKWLETRKIAFPKRQAVLFYRVLFWACIPAVLLSFLWSKPGAVFFIVAGIAGVVQLLAFFPFLQILYKSGKTIKQSMKPIVRKIGIGIVVILMIKYLFQFLGAFPAIVDWITVTRNLIIAYLHWVLLGIFSISMLIYLIEQELIPLRKWSVIGLWLFIMGFILTETFLFAQSGLSLFSVYLPNFGTWMFYTTIPLPLGVLFLFLSQCLTRSLNKKANPIRFNIFFAKLQKKENIPKSQPMPTKRTM